MLKTWLKFSALLMLLGSFMGSALAANESDNSFQYSAENMAGFVFIQQAVERKYELMDSMHRWPEQSERMWNNATKGQGWDGISELALIFAAMIVIGLLVERVIGFKLSRLAKNITEQNSESWQGSLGLLLLRGGFRLLALLFFTLSAYSVPLLVYEDQDNFRIITLTLLNVFVTIRALNIIAEMIWAPNAAGLRLMKLECSDAWRFYIWTMLFVCVYQFSTASWKLFYEMGIEPIMFAAIVPVNGLITNLIAIAFVFINREAITNLFTDGRSASGIFTQNVRQLWPVLLSVWLLAIWAVWATNEFMGYYQQADAMTPAWWITISFPFLDRLIYMLLSRLKDIQWLQSHSYERRCDTFINRTMLAIRSFLVLAVLYHMINGFGYNTLEMVAEMAGHYIAKILDVLVVLVIAYAVWEVIQSAIERHLPAEMLEKKDNGMASLEGEGGGAGATRSETLLPLVRSFLMVFLVVCVTLTLLSILGVEIAPLLAGAGIVGIAVGFGAQKLVQDVISGIFFLLDDAFRRGEYIEAAGLRGTVERISIRSIRLRHHLGAVQTIPFSEMATVTNLSRDWITMKLEFRLAYDTNVEKVRKVIKKVGQKMMEHEEYGQHFLLPLKSQGVIRVEESALIFRMKFTCVPGEQWVIRREAYRHVKDALADNDIHFAHRSVHVLMPDSYDAIDSPQNQPQLSNVIGGGAAFAASPELRRHDKIDDDKANSFGMDSDSP